MRSKLLIIWLLQKFLSSFLVLTKNLFFTFCWRERHCSLLSYHNRWLSQILEWMLFFLNLRVKNTFSLNFLVSSQNFKVFWRVRIIVWVIRWCPFFCFNLISLRWSFKFIIFIRITRLFWIQILILALLL